MIPWSGCIEQTGTLLIFTCSVLPIGSSGPLGTFPYGVITLGVSFSCIMSMTLRCECFGSARGSWVFDEGALQRSSFTGAKNNKSDMSKYMSPDPAEYFLNDAERVSVSLPAETVGWVFAFSYESGHFTHAVDIFRLEHLHPQILSFPFLFVRSTLL